MRSTPKHALPLALLLAVPFALVPNAVMAQEAEAQEAEAQEADEIQACTAAVTPSQIPAGEAAVKVTVTFTEDFGAIDGLQAPEGSGLAIVSPEEVPMEELANSEEEAAAEAEEMVADEAAGANTFVVWLNSLEATAGTFDVTLIGENGTCTASVEVTGAVEPSN